MDFLLTSEQEMLQKMVRQFTEKEIRPSSQRRDTECIFERAIFEKVAALGLTALPWPEELGGFGLDEVSYAIVVEEISRVCASTATTYSAHLSLVSTPIFAYGSKSQKNKWLRPLAEGKKLGGCAFREEENDQHIKTSAELKGEHYFLNGTKCMVVNGGEADLYVTFARTTLNEVSAFLIEANTPGLQVGEKKRKLGFRATAITDLAFQNCKIPKENRLGTQGNGLEIARYAYKSAQIAMTAQAVGIAQVALEEAIAYAKQRIQFGKPISTKQAIAFKLADMATKVEASRLLLYESAWKQSKGLATDSELAISKQFASDMAMEVTAEAVQIYGGYGYMKDYPVERFMRDAKMTQLFYQPLIDCFLNI